MDWKQKSDRKDRASGQIESEKIDITIRYGMHAARLVPGRGGSGKKGEKDKSFTQKNTKRNRKETKQAKILLDNKGYLVFARETVCNTRIMKQINIQRSKNKLGNIQWGGVKMSAEWERKHGK